MTSSTPSIWHIPFCMARIRTQEAPELRMEALHGTPRFDMQRLRVPSSNQPTSHLLNPQGFYTDAQDSLVSVKSYRSESHMQRVSVSGMNYTARDVLLYAGWPPMFHVLYASLIHRNGVCSSFWASDNSSHSLC